MVAHSPRNLQDHLYASFLEGSTADVALHISGSWHAVYKLHRVVLIQAEFFRRLFTAGFSESRFRQRPSRCGGPEPIHIHFSDPNITRPAFEICISRLYGGGPQLYVPSILIPTPLYPLTSSFPNYTEPEATPPGYHPVTPRFLLSLLATAIYLSIPSVTGQSLRHILTTVGPTTVIRYLNFAIGKGIGPEEENAPEAAVGLEHLAEIAKPDTADVASISSRLSCLPMDDDETRKEDPAEAAYDEDCDEESTDERHFIYGGVSDKVGEAAACWLTRWGYDMLTYEEEESSSPVIISASPLKKHSCSAFSSVMSAQTFQSIPLIWRRGGLDPRWVRAILSSDLLFVRGERERYEMAKAVLELRRKGGIDEEEEKEFVDLFENGIYFMHMSTEDLMLISHDVSRTTGRPYVSTNRLYSSHWKQSELRLKVGSAVRDKELGITCFTSEMTIPPDVASPPPTPYWVVASDSSERIGDATGLENATMDQLFTGLPHDDNKKAIPANTSEVNFFGIFPPLQNAVTAAHFDPESRRKWSPFPPIRFGVEFWDVDCLKEKTRMHSHTIWYAGSLYNSYVQVIRKKGVQLGVYLHRQSHIDPLPSFSVPSPRRSEFPRTTSFRPHSNSFSSTIQSTDPCRFPTPPSASTLTLGGGRSTTPVSAQPGSPTSSSPPSGNRTTSPVNHPTQPYRDPRSAISAYFSISCASATGASVTRFSSGPDTFAISQSWGWKSSTLRTEEFLELGDDGQPLPIGLVDVGAGKLVSLRATIVIGII
ncbi:hypothetical protein BDM02DRAFT_3184031 [Thelephora ganbajun]|uniref:Uncharacterized protein n=1 Tax=Thelephora ganbajun TaxID=370292 RepID=A0ACB6ZRB0_THEGA|nr:hypothetical protein BDM02DRAFT_3184031 [Thelephora ganbajun]